MEYFSKGKFFVKTKLVFFMKHKFINQFKTEYDVFSDY